MKVSIITISFNSADTIEDTIKSVISQDYHDLEYIIVDGGSTDNTLNIIEKYREKIHKFISEKDKGIYDAMNKGVEMASGALIGILNSDDIYADEHVISDVMSTLGQADAVYADLVYVKRDNVNEIVRYWKAGKLKPNSFHRGWMPPHPTFFLRKKCYNQFGNYNLSLRSAADYELMLRMIVKNGISVHYLPRIITKMRIGGQSNVTLKNRLKANKEDREAWKINGLTPNFFTLTIKPVRKITQFIKKPKNEE
jgi:glycosyltransferase involved in cell wall biosynthesis